MTNQPSPHRRHFSMTATAFLALLLGASIPTTTQAGESGLSGGKQEMLPGVAGREIARRQENVQQARNLTEEGDKLMSRGDCDGAVSKYREALNILPNAEATDDLRRRIGRKFGKAGVACARMHAGGFCGNCSDKGGDYDKARALLEEVLLPTRDPGNRQARVLLTQLDDPERFPPAASPEHTQNVHEVKRLLALGESHYLLGNYDEAEKQFNTALTIDHYNKAARAFLEKIERTRMDYYGAAYTHTRARMIRMVDEKWETKPPMASSINDQSLGNSTSGVDLRAKNRRKLQNIIIPTINFQSTTLAEALEFLRIRSKSEDKTPGLAPNQRGVNLLIRAQKSAVAGDTSYAEKQIDELILNRAPLGEVLKYLAEATGMRVKIEEYAVLLVPTSEITADLYTRSFRVPPSFIPPADQAAGGGGGAEIDPFAGGGATGGASVKPRLKAKDYLISLGVPFPEKATANFDGRTSTLTVRNTSQAMELIEAIVEQATLNQPKQVSIETKFVEVQQRNGKELGFDWLMGPSMNSDGVIMAGGASGNGVPANAANYALLDPLTGIGGREPLPLGRNPVTAGNRTGDFGVTRNAIDSILNTSIADVGNDSVAPGVLTVAGLLTEPQFQVVMRALDQKKGTDLLSAPSITTRSGLPGRIEIIREFIYPTEYDPPQLPNQVGNFNNGGGVNPPVPPLPGANPAEVTGFPVTPATPTAFEKRNVGVTLEVDPTVSPSGYTIDLNLVPEVVEFEGFINYGNPITSPAIDGLGRPTQVIITENRIEMPIFSTRRVKTQVTVWDGRTVAIGGLIREDVQDIEDKVPIFGDIPIAGRLFKTVSEDRFKRNLMVFVTARLIDPSGKPVNELQSSALSFSEDELAPLPDLPSLEDDIPEYPVEIQK